jgi:hypothetical protein
MRLKPVDPNASHCTKLRKFNQTLKSYKNERLLGDIDSTNDTMNAVASAFLMLPCQPTKRNAERSGSGRTAIDIFNEEKVVFESESPEIISKIDHATNPNHH